MTHAELRQKYGDGVKNNNYEYPSHFFSPWDDFTMHIPNWELLLQRFKGVLDLNFLEMGCANGRASYWMCDQILTGENSRLYSIDQFETQRYIPKKNWHIQLNEEVDISFKENLKPMIDIGKCVFIQSTVNDFMRMDNSREYDFIYIDASHEPEDVLDDAIEAFKALKPGGIIVFDDYGWGNCRYGIDGFMLAYTGKYDVIFTGYQVAIEKK